MTGYDPQEIALFLERANNAHIVDQTGQPDPLAYADAEEPKVTYLATVLMTAVLLGSLNRRPDGKFKFCVASVDQFQEA